jgi:dTDP-4-amino-4,6-dideoxygalactose transaminase
MAPVFQVAELLPYQTVHDVIPHNRLTFDDRECENIVRAVRSGRWAQGPQVQELETELARMAEVKHAVCVASGLSALRLALGAIDAGRDDLVIVPAYSCVALANAALNWGALPLAVDVEAKNWNLDFEQCRRQISERPVRAIIAVNTFGAAAPIEDILPLGVPTIEDCAHAFGRKVNGRPFGSRASIAVLSFYATKLIGGGEGGAVLTNVSEIAEFVRRARDYGDQAPNAHLMNDKMTDLEASLVLAQLQRLPEMIAAREKIALRYFRLLRDSAAECRFRLPAENDGRIWYRFVVEMLDQPASAVVREMELRYVHAVEPVYDWRTPGTATCPTADRAYHSLVSLPIYPTLTTDEQDAVVDAFLQTCRSKSHA